MCIYIYIYTEREREIHVFTYIYIYIYITSHPTCGQGALAAEEAPPGGAEAAGRQGVTTCLRPVHLLRVFLLRVLESNFPGDSLPDSMDMRIPTPYN